MWYRCKSVLTFKRVLFLKRLQTVNNIQYNGHDTESRVSRLFNVIHAQAGQKMAFANFFFFHLHTF